MDETSFDRKKPPVTVRKLLTGRNFLSYEEIFKV
jgi:hypothetical protein